MPRIRSQKENKKAIISRKVINLCPHLLNCYLNKMGSRSISGWSYCISLIFFFLKYEVFTKYPSGFHGSHTHTGKTWNVLKWTQLTNPVSSQGHIRDDRTLVLISLRLQFSLKRITHAVFKYCMGTKKKSQNLMNTSTKHFVFESEGKAVPLMKITKVLTDLFLL